MLTVRTTVIVAAAFFVALLLMYGFDWGMAAAVFVVTAVFAIIAYFWS